MTQQTRNVDISELEEGDLLFFDITGSGISHVDVYLKDQKFVHASVVKGVTVNSLQEKYYQEKFKSAGRILTVRKHEKD
ncbi:hypothetical protein CH373_03845 [Leptospira perolatii]|uniref:NlpC/P60 domain-containing protein n=2 Tax=Leptospira perolatii TaxID=2023191 RepID=A0A2M9ZTM1_9LEPT|nr:hypothetical protein CH360_14725 [Leptospira perolatii]PJZ75243.1 hypothetical protein CH373_03845 [Leptospira perolatii]